MTGVDGRLSWVALLGSNAPAGRTFDRFVGELSYGGGAVNQVNIHFFIETMPFGGVGPAGMGHYYGKYGFDILTHAKSMLISPPDIAIDHLFLPYTSGRTPR